MKKNLLMLGILSIIFNVPLRAMEQFSAKENARILVKHLFAPDIEAKFAAGQTNTEDRKRLREEIEDDSPLAYRGANRRSLGQLLRWKAKHFQEEQNQLPPVVQQ